MNIKDSKIKNYIKNVLGMFMVNSENLNLTHREVVDKVTIFAKYMQKFLNIEDELLEEVIDGVIFQYEENVGIKNFEPDIIFENIPDEKWKSSIENFYGSFIRRYEDYLDKEDFLPGAISNIVESSKRTLMYCANPNSKNKVERKKGLVVGDVQSGKTANYLGLINLAFDHGYKLVLILAGTTDYLRTQTQIRVDSGVIGAESDSIGNDIVYVGVGEPEKKHYVVPFTNKTNDFGKFISDNLNSALDDYVKPVILVVKKNADILRIVSDKLKGQLKNHDSSNILIIDDEADNASLNTNKDSNNPTKINKLIRNIFNQFPIASYVGYTATPFANVFVNPYDDDDDNLDLFPSDFIVQLHAPSSYFGGEKVFPEYKFSGNGYSKHIRKIYENEKNLIPLKHKKDVEFNELPESMKEAVYTFLLNNVIRTLRGSSTKHRSMMINITKLNCVQSKICFVVNEFVEELKNEIESLYKMPLEKFLKNEKLKKIYDMYNYSDFYLETRKGSERFKPLNWGDVQKLLLSEIKQFKVVTINSKNKVKNARKEDERFSYEKYKDVGARVIVIGGQVLSRGLTLEGLMVSYYNRNAGAYDTLLQMCRWFGYRNKYEDLCRIYMSEINIEAFDCVLDATDNLKEQFLEMKLKGKKPKDYGLMVKESPETLETTLLVTARNKMKESKEIAQVVNFGGYVADTTKISKNKEQNDYNYNLFMKFYKDHDWKWYQDGKRYMARNVDSYDIADLIRKIRVPYINKKFQNDSIAEYIDRSDVFDVWDVVIATGGSKKTLFEGEPKLRLTERKFDVRDDDDYIGISGSNNRLIDPGILDSGLEDLTAEKRRKIIESLPLNRKGEKRTEMSAMDYLKLRDTPILVIFPIDLKTKDKDGNEELEKQKREIKDGFGNNPVIGFAVGFPGKETEVKITYRFNKIKLDELKKEREEVYYDDEEEL